MVLREMTVLFSHPKTLLCCWSHFPSRLQLSLATPALLMHPYHSVPRAEIPVRLVFGSQESKNLHHSALIRQKRKRLPPVRTEYTPSRVRTALPADPSQLWPVRTSRLASSPGTTTDGTQNLANLIVLFI